MTQDSVPQEGTTRRAALSGVGLAGLAAALTACGAGGGGGTGTGALASTSEIPVGGGKVFSAEKVVVTQPSAGKSITVAGGKITLA